MARRADIFALRAVVEKEAGLWDSVSSGLGSAWNQTGRRLSNGAVGAANAVAGFVPGVVGHVGQQFTTAGEPGYESGWHATWRQLAQNADRRMRAGVRDTHAAFSTAPWNYDANDTNIGRVGRAEVANEIAQGRPGSASVANFANRTADASMQAAIGGTALSKAPVVGPAVQAANAGGLRAAGTALSAAQLAAATHGIWQQATGADPQAATLAQMQTQIDALQNRPAASPQQAGVTPPRGDGGGGSDWLGQWGPTAGLGLMLAPLLMGRGRSGLGLLSLLGGLGLLGGGLANRGAPQMPRDATDDQRFALLRKAYQEGDATAQDTLAGEAGGWNPAMLHVQRFFSPEAARESVLRGAADRFLQKLPQGANMSRERAMAVLREMLAQQPG